MPGRLIRFCALAAALCAGSVQAQSLPAYGLTLIAAPSGSAGLTPAALNATGQVTGSIAFFAGQASHAFLYSGGTLTDLGTLPFPGSATFGSATGQSITAIDGIVGTVTDPGTPPQWQFGFIYSAGGALEPLNMLTGFPFCTATATNAQGTIVGACSNTTETIATIYQNGTPQQIGPSGATANAVNDYNQVAATGTPGFLYANGTLTPLPLLSGGSANTQSGATSVNNAGQAVGWQLNGSSYQSFFYSNGATTALAGVPVSAVQPALSMNDAGQIVGYTATSSTATPVPFFFAHGLMTPLNALLSATDPSQRYVTLTMAYAINDSGQIIASGTDSRAPGTTRAYLLTPTSPFSSSVDLQASVTTIGVGSSFTLFWTAQNLASCSADGGSGNDGWQGSVPANGGQQVVKETKGGDYTFTLNCTSSSGSMENAQAMVTVTAPPTPPASGGGALDAGTLAAWLAVLAGARRRGRRSA
jgi:probable HAF family extracellular repeat protein